MVFQYFGSLKPLKPTKPTKPVRLATRPSLLGAGGAPARILVNGHG